MEGLFANLMRVTLNMSALAALTLLCTPLLKKRYSANWRYWVWMVIAIRLLIPFQMSAIELPDLKEPFQAALSSAWPEQKNQKLPDPFWNPAFHLVLFFSAHSELLYFAP